VTNDPPPYRLRVTPWARGISLRVTLAGDLEVVAPRRYAPRTIVQVLRREAAWIRAAQAAAASRRQTLPPPPPWRLPARIALPAVGLCWTVALHPSPARYIRLVDDGEQGLVVAGPLADPGACRRAIRRWLLRQGLVHLPPLLAEASRRCGLPYSRSAIRLARSRWGSCSRTAAISLNARLLLLPPPLVDYVLVHELCHTLEPNHSPAFWRLVAQHCPAYPNHRAALRAAGRRLPAWALDPANLVASAPEDFGRLS
jgi:predicted metal-dependent hydrolase